MDSGSDWRATEGRPDEKWWKAWDRYFSAHTPDEAVGLEQSPVLATFSLLVSAGGACWWRQKGERAGSGPSLAPSWPSWLPSAGPSGLDQVQWIGGWGDWETPKGLWISQLLTFTSVAKSTISWRLPSGNITFSVTQTWHTQSLTSLSSLTLCRVIHHLNP